MRVLVDGMPNSFGGIGTLISNIVKCNEGDSSPIEFAFLLQKESVYCKLYAEKGYKVFVIPRITDVVQYIKSVKRIFGQEHFDVVWINNTSKVNVALPYLAKRSGARIAVHSHGVSCEERGLKKHIFAFIEFLNKRKYFELLDIPLSCSNLSTEYFYRGFSGKDSVRVIKNGIDVEKFCFNEEKRIRFRSELNLATDQIAICACGRLTEVKNYPFLIRLMTKLPSQYVLYIIGDGPDEADLKKLIKDQGMENRVTLLGFKENVADYLNAMDIYTMPSFNEGLPFALIEAQANGLPCVVSDGITKEAALSDIVQFCSIEDSVGWKACILNASIHKDRENGVEPVVNAGFNIKESFESIKELFEWCD